MRNLGKSVSIIRDSKPGKKTGGNKRTDLKGEPVFRFGKETIADKGGTVPEAQNTYMTHQLIYCGTVL